MGTCTIRTGSLYQYCQKWFDLASQRLNCALQSKVSTHSFGNFFCIWFFSPHNLVNELHTAVFIGYLISLIPFRKGCILGFVLDLKVWWQGESTAIPSSAPTPLPLMPQSVIFMCATPFPWTQRSKTLSNDDIWMPGFSFPHALASVNIVCACVGLCVFYAPGVCLTHSGSVLLINNIK